MSLTRKVHKVQRGETVLIHAAAGGTGLLLVQLCKLAGATVIGTTSTDEKKAMATNAGADHVILYKSEDIKSRVMEITQGKGVQAVFDGIGKTTFATSLSCLAMLGSMVSFGNASGKVADIDIMSLVPNCIRLTRPSLFQLIKTRDDFLPLATELLELLHDNKLRFHVSKVYALADSPAAHTDLETQKTMGKIVLQCL
ncbi:hypothetical protein HDU91_004839 [Kappamyces sp. JEL0680]|nr:hypothetical protein HDU91_004839 [Kappamyces sp. JEL0680]